MDAESSHYNDKSEATLIKRYANRKLYNTSTSRYITLKGIAELIEDGCEIRVVDNESGEDITSVTLSQILVDNERTGPSLPGTVLSDLIQKSGDALYTALKRGVGDTAGSIDEIQRNVRRFLDHKGERARDVGAEWIAVATPDFERMIQGAVERALRLLDLPSRTDIDRLTRRLDETIERLDGLETRRRNETTN